MAKQRDWHHDGVGRSSTSAAPRRRCKLDLSESRSCRSGAAARPGFTRAVIATSWRVDCSTRARRHVIGIAMPIFGRLHTFNDITGDFTSDRAAQRPSLPSPAWYGPARGTRSAPPSMVRAATSRSSRRSRIASSSVCSMTMAASGASICQKRVRSAGTVISLALVPDSDTGSACMAPGIRSAAFAVIRTSCCSIHMRRPSMAM